MAELKLPLQQNVAGKYASGLIDGRFQIFASQVGSTFYVVDLTTDDGVMPDTEFDTIEQAQAFIRLFTAYEMHGKGKTLMAIRNDATLRARKEITAAIKSADRLDATIGEKTVAVPTRVSKKISTLRAEPEPAAEPVPVPRRARRAAAEPDVEQPPEGESPAVIAARRRGAARAARGEAPIAPAAPAPRRARRATVTEEAANGEAQPTQRRGRGPSQDGTQAAMFRRLIMEGQMTKDEIHDAVEAQFNRKLARNAVDYYTRFLQDRGYDVPKLPA